MVFDSVRHKSRTREEAAYRRVDVLRGGVWTSISPPHLKRVSLSNGFNQIGRATFEIHTDGDEFNYRRPGWSGVLNKKGTEVKIYEGWGSDAVKTFDGFIEEWGMEGDGTGPIKIIITCLNQMVSLEGRSLPSQVFAEGTAPADVLRGCLASAGVEAEVPELPVPPGSDNPSARWETVIGRVSGAFDTSRTRDGFLGIGNTVYLEPINAVAFLQSDGLRILNLLSNSFLETGLGFGAIGVHGGAGLFASRSGETVFSTSQDFTTRNIATQRLTTVCTPNFNEWNLKLRKVTRFSHSGLTWSDTVLRPTPRHPSQTVSGTFIESAVITDDGGSVYVVANSRIFVGDLNRGTSAITFRRLLSMESPEILDSPTINLLQLSPDTISIYYSVPAQTTHALKTFSLQGDLMSEIMGVGFSTSSPILRVASMGGMVATESTIMDPGTGELRKIEWEPLVSGQGNPVHLGTSKLVMFPSRSLATDLSVRTLTIPLTISEPPSFSMEIPEGAAALPTLGGLLSELGLSMFADNATGEFRISLPQVKAAMDYVFEGDVDVTEAEVLPPDLNIGTVILNFGREPSSGTVRVGSMPGAYIKRVPHLNRAGAIQLGERLLTEGAMSSVNVSARAIPLLAVGHSIGVLDDRFVGVFRGVCTEYSTENSDSGYFGEWTLLGS